jgi:aminotransferase
MNYDKVLSEKIKKIKPSGIRKFFDLVIEIKDAVSLGVGEPDFITPWSIRNAAIRSVQKGYTQYTSNSGLFELREKIAEYLSVRYNLKYNPKNEIVVTVGASEAIDLSMRAIINPGDEILIPEPSYVSYSPCVIMAGGIPVPIKCIAENSFKLTPENIEKNITSKTKAVLLPYPTNPTGGIMDRESLEKVAAVIKKYDLLVISDEIYSELTYGAKHVSIASLEGMKERCIVINGFSKSFAMTGWRLGYFAAPEEITAAMLKLHQYVIMCAPTNSQYAALEALTEGLKDNFALVEEMREEYDKRRRFIVNAFNNMGLKCPEPLGAFYVFPDVSCTGMDGGEFAEKLLKEKKVAVVPGDSFGNFGINHIRCSYAYSMKTLDYAVGKISEFVKEIKI